MRFLKLMLVVSILTMGNVLFVHAQQSPLDTVIPEVNFDQVPLQNALAYLVGERGIHLDIDPRLSALPVTLSRSNQTLRSILQEIARQVTADFVYDEKTNTVHFRFKPYDRITLRFLNVYDAIMLFGGSIIVPFFSPMSMGGFGGWGGWGGGWGGLGGWGGWGGGWGGLGGWGGGWGGLGGWGGGWGGGTRGWGGGWGGGLGGAGRRSRGGGTRGRGGGW
ncbi:hypothetical protein GG496_001449 [Candidatus Fervidibacteria bacterium JGI MDM2 JNZ-1-D12]